MLHRRYIGLQQTKNRFYSKEVKTIIVYIKMNDKIIYLNPNTEGFYQLTEAEQRLLCFCAYCLDKNDDVSLKAYKKLFQLKQEDLVKQCNYLRHKGFINYNGHRFFEYIILPECFFCAAYFLVEKHPEWLQAFKKFTFQPSNTCSYLWQVVEASLGNQPMPQTGVMDIKYVVRSVFPQCLNPQLRPLLMQFSPEILLDMLQKTLILNINKDQLTTEIMEYLQEVSCVLPIKEQTIFHESIQLGKYLLNGNGLTPTKPISPDGFLHYGLVKLYKGEYSEAIQLIDKALKLQNKELKIKHIFLNPIKSYFQVLAYEKDRSSTTLKKLEKIRSKQDYMGSHLTVAAHIVTEYVNTPESMDVTALFSLGQYALNIPIYGYFYHLFVYYFQLSKSLEETMPHLKTFKQPKLGILRHEMAECLQLNPDERAELEKLYGGKPLLTSIRNKQKWELTLENLLQEIQTIQEQTDTIKGPRIAYFCNRYEQVEIREQSILKSGEWSSGRAVSMSRFIMEGVACMDETDKQIAAIAGRRYMYNLDMQTIAPHLIRSDRVFYGNRAPYLPVKIEEEKPYLIIKKEKDGFVIKSNVSPKEMYSSNPSQVIQKKPDHYVVIPLDRQKARFYSELIALEKIPLSAETELKAFLPKVAEIIEVHSDLIEGGSTLKELPSDSRSFLQFLPANECYDLQIRICPLEGGRTRFLPGTGETIIFDERDGVRYQVKRNLREEKKRYAPLADYIENLTDTELTEGTVCLNTEQVLHTLDYVRQHPEDYIVEWPKGEKIRLKGMIEPKDWNIRLRSKAGWFEMEGEVKISDDQILSAAEFLQLMRHSTGSFIRLNEKDFLLMTEALHRQMARLESLVSYDRNKARISSFHVGQLADILHQGNTGIQTDRKYEELLQRINKAATLWPEKPAALQTELREYQQEGFSWICRLDAWGAGACLADDMGLGKTVQTIAFLLYKAHSGPSLVVAPASVVPNWERELQRFAPTLNIRTLNREAERQQAIGEAGPNDIILTTYGLLVTEEACLTQKEWNVLCLDEAHTIKNRETKMSAAAMKLQGKSRLILTGTPIQNYLGELWNLFQFINPGLLGSYEQFNTRFIQPIEADKNKEKQLQLKRIIQPFMLRRTKAEVVEELPDKIEIMRPVQMSEEEMAIYEVLRAKAEQAVESEDQVNISTLAEITKLRQAACSISLVDKKWNEPSSKTEAFIGLAQIILQGGNHALVFSQFTSYLKEVASALDKEGIAYLMLDGSTPIKKREKYVQEFQAGKYPIFLISLKAGGLGLNLTGANYVIHLDPWWNPAIEQQATDRAYRIGQQQKVTVYRLISEQTIEEKILRLHQSKRDLADSLLEGTDMSHKLTVKDLMDMLSKDL